MINYAHWLVLLSALVSIFGATTYIRDTLRGESKPNRVTWGLWAIVPLIATGAAISVGADIWATTRVFLAGFLPALVFIASFVNPQSFWKLTFFDSVCCISALFALIAWGLVDSPRLAVLLAAIGDAFACLPTIRKAWKYPETETGITYIASFTSVLLVLPSIPIWNIENSAFQLVLLFSNAILIFAVYRSHLGFGSSISLSSRH